MEYDPLNRTIYRKLCTVIPNLPEHLKAGTEYGKSALGKSGLMDLSYDYILEEKPGEHLIALGHRYEQNGDLVPDPDMEIRVIPIKEIAEALSFNNIFLYQHVESNEKKNEKLQRDLNEFLDQWLDACIAHGHRIELSKVKSREDDLDDLRSEEREPGIER